jgi:hypothetical protein
LKTGEANQMPITTLAPTTTAPVFTRSHVSVNLEFIVGMGRLARRVGPLRFVRLIPLQAHRDGLDADRVTEQIVLTAKYGAPNMRQLFLDDGELPESS